MGWSTAHFNGRSIEVNDAVMEVWLALLLAEVDALAAAPAWLAEAREVWRAHATGASGSPVAPDFDGELSDDLRRGLVHTLALRIVNRLAALGDPIPASALNALGAGGPNDLFTSDVEAWRFLEPARALVALLERSFARDTPSVRLFDEVFYLPEDFIEQLAPFGCAADLEAFERAQDALAPWVESRRRPLDGEWRELHARVVRDYRDCRALSLADGAALAFGLIVHATRAAVPEAGRSLPLDGLRAFEHACVRWLTSSGLFDRVESAESSAGWRRASALYDELMRSAPCVGAPAERTHASAR